jgi:hypothetical protein
MFNTMENFPVISPTVSFTGPIINSGHTLLHNESISGLGDIQRKCCGFIQLSTFITPGNVSKTPFRGVHPFQVFIIFPIHANPWLSLCKKMIERQDSQFQPNTLFTCTGKVAGFLNHNVMVHPPLLAEDRVFIVVPTTWNFLDKATLRDSISVAPLPSTPPKQSSTQSFNKSKFMSPSKPPTPQSAASTPSHSQPIDFTSSC